MKRFLSSIFICGNSSSKKRHYKFEDQQHILRQRQKDFSTWFRENANENHEILDWMEDYVFKRDESLRTVPQIQDVIHCLHHFRMITKTFSIDEPTGEIRFFFTFYDPLTGKTLHERFSILMSLLELC